MSNGISLCVPAAGMTSGGLSVFIRRMPPIRQAQATDGPLVVSMSVAVFIWAKSAAALWSMAHRSLTEKARASLPVCEPQQPPTATRGGDSDV